MKIVRSTKIILGVILGVAIGVVVWRLGFAGVSPNSVMTLKLQDEPQTAVFYTARGMTGGMGDPVFGDNDRPVMMKGYRLWLAQGSMDKIRAFRHLPDSYRDRERIVVKARFRIESATAINHSIPGGVQTNFKRLIVEEVLDVAWKGTPYP